MAKLRVLLKIFLLATPFALWIVVEILLLPPDSPLKKHFAVPYIGCTGDGYSDDTFLADCGYTNYDHAALFYNFQKTDSYLKSADVLILGNSRAGFGFNNEEASAFFSQHGLSYYFMHFSNGESSQFPMKIYKELKLKPKVIIVNAEYFFSSMPHKIGKKILDGRMSSFYFFSHIFQSVHRSICRPGSNSSIRRLAAYDPCAGHKAIFRSRKSGSWVHSIDNPPKNFEVTGSETNKDYLYSILGIASNFVAETEIPKECVIFTTVPAPNENPNYGRDLANALGLPYVEAKVSGLASLDGSHLDKLSAQKWTNAFFKEVKPAVENCLAVLSKL